MELKFEFSPKRIMNELFAIILSAAIVILCMSTVLTVCFHSDSIIKKNLQNYTPETIELVNQRLEYLANETGFPVEAYLQCFDENAANMVYDKVISNINYQYPTDFKDDIEIYQQFKNSLTNYCYENGINVSNKEISENSCLAVDAINEALGGYSTARISIMNFARSKIMVALIIAPALVIVACLIIINLVNKGRHRRLNYYGLGCTTSGAVMVIASLFAFAKKYVTNFVFCENIIYNAAVKDLTNFALKIIITLGIILFVFGTVLLVNTYNYFKDKQKNKISFVEEKQKMMDNYNEEFFEKHIEK